MKRQNVLIVCYDVSDLHRIVKINLPENGNVIIASDDFRVHKKCEEYTFVNTVTFLQKPMSYTRVANNVIQMIEQINSFYCDVEKLGIFKKEMMQWPYHVEGGDTTQLIQNTLLGIESLKLLIRTHVVDRVIVLESANHKLYTDVVQLTCGASYLKCELINSSFTFLKYKKMIKTFLKPWYGLFKTSYIKLFYLFEKQHNEKNVALIWLFNSAKKHIVNTLFIDNILKKSGYNPIIFTWKVFKIDDKTASTNLNIQRIESYVPWDELLKTAMKICLVFINQRKIGKLSQSHSYVYNNIDISKIIKPIVMDSILTESPSLYCFEKGFSRFLNINDIDVIPGLMSGNRLGMIIEGLLDINMLKFSFIGFLEGESPYIRKKRQAYKSEYWKNFVFFVQNKLERNRIFQDTPLSSKDVIIYGSLRGESYRNQKIENSKNDILKRLDFKNEYDYYVLFDFPVQLTGYQSLEEVILVLNTVLEFIRNRSDIALLIKPHSSAKIAMLDDVKSQKVSNVYIFNKHDSINDLLAISDVLITKYSTLGIEAMFYDTIVLSMQLDQSDDFKMYGEEANYIYSTLELNENLSKLFQSKTSFDMIQKENLSQNIKYIEELYPELETSQEEIIIRELKVKSKH